MKCYNSISKRSRLERQNLEDYLDRSRLYRLIPLESEIPGYKTEAKLKKEIANEAYFQKIGVVKGDR